jgi:hypothetical protein
MQPLRLAISVLRKLTMTACRSQRGGTLFPPRNKKSEENKMDNELEIINDLKDITERARSITLTANILKNNLTFEKDNNCKIKRAELFTLFDNSIKRLEDFTKDLEFFYKKIQELKALEELDLASKLDFNKRLIDIEEMLAFIAKKLVEAAPNDN